MRNRSVQAFFEPLDKPFAATPVPNTNTISCINMIRTYIDTNYSPDGDRMKSTLVPLLFALILTLTISLHADQYSDTQVRIYLDNLEQRQLLRSLALDIVWVEPGYVEIITNPEQLESLTQLGFKTEVVHESVGEFYRSRLPEKDMGGYKTLAEANAYLDGIIADHPDIVSAKISFGTTIEGRPMWAARISDNPNVDEDEPELLFASAVHAREVNTPDILFYYVDHVTDNYGIDPQITDLIDNREIWIIPICNPDGYYHNEVIAPYGGGMWRLNRRDNGDGTFGVDINRNYGYMWGYDDDGSSPTPGSPTYRGTGPFSEPETQALRDFMISRDFVLALHWHQYGDVTIYPWAYDHLATPDNDIFSALGDTIYQMNGYDYGLIHDMIFYGANGGAFDWDYGEQTLKNKVFSITVEAGTYSDGFWPTLARAQEQREENLEPMLFLTRLAGNIYQLRGPEPPEIVGLPASVDGTGYTVGWIHDDPNNPAVNYELLELQQRRVIIDPAETLDHWAPGSFTVSSNRAYSSETSLYSGALTEGAVNISTVYPYTVVDGDELRFMTYYDMGFYTDFMYVEISIDGQTFESIPGNLTSDYNPYGRNRGNGISGSMGDWVEAVFDLSAYVGQGVWFRIVYEVDDGSIAEGVYIDDFYPHLVFDTQTVIASDITETSFAFADKPLGVYYYQVRAQDAESQWGSFSWVAETDVLGYGTGDIDLDGINSSIADLTLYNLYFQQGLPAFDVYDATQIAQTDINCDELTLTQADANTLAEIVIGSGTPCYTGTRATDRIDRTTSALGKQGDYTRSLMPAADPATYSVEIQTTVFEPRDSAYVDIVLTEATAGLLGFQFHLDPCQSIFSLEDVRFGDGLAGWQLLDYDIAPGGCGYGLTLIGVAWAQGDPIGVDDIEPPSLPLLLARLKLSVGEPSMPIDMPIQFLWENCGDNTIVSGHLDGTDLVIDYLGLSNRVYDSYGVDITGVDPIWGGADYTCFYGLFGDQPQPAIDFTLGRLYLPYIPLTCCDGRVGNPNGVGGDEPTIGDVSVMVDAKFISGSCDGIIECLKEGDINQSGGVDPTCDDITIGDISTLIDYLFITGPSLGLPDCL